MPSYLEWWFLLGTKTANINTLLDRLTDTNQWVQKLFLQQSLLIFAQLVSSCQLSPLPLLLQPPLHGLGGEGDISHQIFHRIVPFVGVLQSPPLILEVQSGCKAALNVGTSDVSNPKQYTRTQLESCVIIKCVKVMGWFQLFVYTAVVLITAVPSSCSLR